MQYTNDATLNAAILNDFQSIVDKISEEILQEVIDSIDNVVYGAGNPNYYTRNGLYGGLSGMFFKTDAMIYGQEIKSDIDNDPSSLKHDPAMFTHGSNYSKKGDDIRDVLIEIITEGLSGYFFGSGWWQAPRDFWQPVLNKIQRGDMDKYIEAEMSRRNIQWTKI